MTTLYNHIDSNNRKTWLLMGVFLAFITTIGWFLSYYYGNASIFYIAIFISIFMNIAGYWWSDKIVLSLAGAKPVTREEYTNLWNIVENLSITAGLPMPKLYVIDDSVPNAFATGRNKDHSAVAVTKGLLDIMDKSELEGVIAHEISHIGNKDILLSTVVVVLVGMVSIIADYFTRAHFFRGGDRDSKGGAQGLLFLVGIFFMILSPIVATIIQLAISRKREFLADASGALLTRYPEGLASALEKLGQHSGRMRNAHNATAHLYISNPFGKQSLGSVAKIFLTHPPIEERVRALRGEFSK